MSLKIREILVRSEYKTLREEIARYADIMLQQYLDELEDITYHIEDKEIFDVIWGPVELNVGEFLLLYSPIIQRLRKIKQLGLASYVYCGAILQSGR